MAAPLVAFALYDSDGAPLEGQAPVLSVYVDRTGFEVAAPAVVEIGAGLYGFSPTEADATAGVAFLVAAPAGASPEFLSGASARDGDVFAFALFDADTGEPVEGQEPEVRTFCDGAGAARTAPAVVEMGGGLYGFAVSAADLSVGVAWEVDCGAGVLPAGVGGCASADEGVQAFALYDDAGAPLEGASAALAAYRDTAGAARSPPTLDELDGGLYGFAPSAADVVAQVAWEATGGGSSTPARLSGTVSRVGTLAAWAAYSSAGAPATGLSPAFAAYKGRDGADYAQPALSALGLGLYGFVASSDDLTIPVAFELATGGYPERISGLIEVPASYRVAVARYAEHALAGASAAALALAGPSAATLAQAGASTASFAIPPTRAEHALAGPSFTVETDP